MTAIGIHTSSIQYAVEIRSSWIVEDGWARPLGVPKSNIPPRVEAVRAKIDREKQGMEAARAEIRRRRKERLQQGESARQCTCTACGELGHNRRTCRV